jgi:hypothetical protein
MRSEEVQRWLDADDAHIERLTANRDVFANAVKAVIEASIAYLPPDGISKDEFISRVLGATDNAEIVAALSSLPSTLHQGEAEPSSPHPSQERQ